MRELGKMVRGGPDAPSQPWHCASTSISGAFPSLIPLNSDDTRVDLISSSSPLTSALLDSQGRLESSADFVMLESVALIIRSGLSRLRTPHPGASSLETLSKPSKR